MTFWNSLMRRSTQTLATLSLAAISSLASAQLIGPSTTISPYVVPLGQGVTTMSLFTVGSVNGSAIDNVGGYRMAGIPDGMGAFDNGDGTFTLVMHHELGPTNGAVHAHGATGAFVSRWVINKNTLAMVSGQDQIQTLNTVTPFTLPANAQQIGRLCSADLPVVGAFYNATTGMGTQERIFMGGEEFGPAPYGRAFAHVLTGANNGQSYELPALGVTAWENVVANPNSGDRTVVLGQDDNSAGRIWAYIGNKTNTGNEIQRAGLTNGQNFRVQIDGFVGNETQAGNIGLNKFGTGGTTARNFSLTAGAGTGFLRPEDSAWDPNNSKHYYFVTTDSFAGFSRLWRMKFNDDFMGGQIEMLLDGTEGQRMFDNLTIDARGNIIIQEDPGNQSHIAKIWRYNVNDGSYHQIAEHNRNFFLAGSPSFLTQDEESSGIFDAESILGKGWFILNVQAHYNIPGELVQGGQLLAMHVPIAAVPEPSTYMALGLGGAMFAAWGARRVRRNRKK